ncbi:MAG: hypothetical protein ACR2QF_11850, partial [Geminicoccaceae bacterium]
QIPLDKPMKCEWPLADFVGQDRPGVTAVIVDAAETECGQILDRPGDQIFVIAIDLVVHVQAHEWAPFDTIQDLLYNNK